MKFLDNYQEQAYAMLRITAGFMFLLHGTQKFFNFPQQYPYGELGFLSIAAGSIELIGGVLIILGLTTRGAAFLCSGTMAVAYWLVHGTKSFYPLVNGGELAALYCFIFLFIACKGSGIWSMDNK
ncbi:DoxX family protein [Porticoccaceae bacterium]|jgi:putative oxidoreductase|nr:DoxX family protein [Porticoccaceae bacterium]